MGLKKDRLARLIPAGPLQDVIGSSIHHRHSDHCITVARNSRKWMGLRSSVG